VVVAAVGEPAGVTLVCSIITACRGRLILTQFVVRVGESSRQRPFALMKNERLQDSRQSEFIRLDAVPDVIAQALDDAYALAVRIRVR
jgi:hypothetical protein